MAVEICLRDEEVGSFNDGRVIPATINRQYNILMDPEDVPGATLDAKYRSARYIAEQALLADDKNCPIVDWNYEGLFRNSLTVKPTGSPDLFRFDATATWERFRPPNDDSQGEATEYLSGSVNRTTVNQKLARERIGTYTYSGGKNVDTGLLIGVTAGEDPEVQGADVSVPTLAFNIKRVYPNGSFTIPFLQAAYTFVGRPNSAAWRGFAIGDVMLVGIDGADSDTEFDHITFSFEAAPTETDIEIPTAKPDGTPATITIPEKRGFDYLWVRTRPINFGDVMVEVAQCAYVDQLEQYVDLNVLIP